MKHVKIVSVDRLGKGVLVGLSDGMSMLLSAELILALRSGATVIVKDGDCPLETLANV